MINTTLEKYTTFRQMYNYNKPIINIPRIDNNTDDVELIITIIPKGQSSQFVRYDYQTIMDDIKSDPEFYDNLSDKYGNK